MGIPTIDPDAPAFVRRGINLADPRLGAAAVQTSDDFFAPMARMLNPEPAVFIPASMTTTANGWTAGNRAASV